MTLFTAYRRQEQPTVKLYAPYWLPPRREVKPPLGGKAAMARAARRGWKRGLQTRRIEARMREL